jgi:hypothetical protein
MALCMVSNGPFRFHLSFHRRNSSKSSYIHYSWSKFHCDWSVIKGTLQGTPMYGFACILIPTRRIFLKIRIWETTHTCYQHCKCLGSRDAPPDVLEVPPTHNYNRTLYYRYCYMVRAASVETLRRCISTIVCGDACLNDYNGASWCPLLV